MRKVYKVEFNYRDEVSNQIRNETVITDRINEDKITDYLVGQGFPQVDILNYEETNE